MFYIIPTLKIVTVQKTIRPCFCFLHPFFSQILGNKTAITVANVMRIYMQISKVRKRIWAACCQKDQALTWKKSSQLISISLLYVFFSWIQSSSKEKIWHTHFMPKFRLGFILSVFYLFKVSKIISKGSFRECWLEMD